MEDINQKGGLAPQGHFDRRLQQNPHLEGQATPAGYLKQALRLKTLARAPVGRPPGSLTELAQETLSDTRGGLMGAHHGMLSRGAAK